MKKFKINKNCEKFNFYLYTWQAFPQISWGWIEKVENFQKHRKIFKIHLEFREPTVTHPLVALLHRLRLTCWSSTEHIRERISQLQQVIKCICRLLLSCRRISGSEKIDNVARRRWRRWKERVRGVGRWSDFRLLKKGKILSLNFCSNFFNEKSIWGKETLYWFMAASSSANTCAFKLSSMPLLCDSNFADDAAVPNDELVEERAETPLFTFFWLLFSVSNFS